jgi:fructokinase
MLRPDGAADYEFDISWAPDPSAASALLGTVDVVHTGSIAAFLDPGASTVVDLISRAAAAGSVVTFDPNIRPVLLGTRDVARERVGELAARAHVVKLSDEDAAWLYPNESLDQVASRLLSMGPFFVVITRGSDGVLVASDSGGVVRVGAPRVTVADTIGAGDSFMSAS